MPIYPIGELKRKGTLGSYYSISDYRAINPEFGTLNDFVELVKEIHNMGMYVLLDWVANHTSWDNYLTHEHPEYYVRNSQGIIQAPFDWEDVADLNYDNKELWQYMIDSMKFWVEKANVDGFRCDVADLVPTPFWNEARKQLDSLKPIFMLAEAENPGLNEYAFDMSYASKLHKTMNAVVRNEKKAYELFPWFEDVKRDFPDNTIMMQFITNHDENSWNGSESERMGEAKNTFAVFSFTVPGMPLIYSGQEVGFKRRLKFFDKDEIDWFDDCELALFYKELVKLKTENPALWNDNYCNTMQWVNTSNDEAVFCFVRKKDDNQVFVALNFSNSVQKVIVKEGKHSGAYKEYFTKAERDFFGFDSLILDPFEYLVYVKN
jgi:glycosidase